MRIILLCSGNLGLVVLKQIYTKENLVFVFTDKDSPEIVEYCNENNIKVYAGNPRLHSAKKTTSTLDCDVLLSVNYIFIVENDMLGIAKKFAINLHGSLLPKYRGRTPHVWAIINGECDSGISAHIMSSEVDCGPIIKQVRVKIDYNDTGYSILQKFNILYPELVLDLLKDIKEDNIILTDQDHGKATYFGKRTSKDGEIDWNWQKERIRNWVRAQAHPYPGAFTFYDDQKIIINEIEFSEWGFNFQDENGTILKTGTEIIIKTPNGAVKLINYKTTESVEFKTGKKLS